MGSALAEHPSEVPVLIDEGLFEVVDGVRLEKAVGYREILLANRLCFFLNQVVLTRALGTAAVEVLVDLGRPEARNRRPDLAYVSRERWPIGRPKTSDNAWPVVPDLAVEVVSPTNTADEIQGKVAEYLEAGVKLVWVIYSNPRSVHIYDGSRTIRLVQIEDELDGGGVIPDFHLPLRTLFEEDVVTP